MGTLAKIITVTIIVLGMLAFAYTGMLALASWRTGYSWQEMDWASKGNTSIGDFLRAGDIGQRKSTIDGKACTEFYAYKDGMTVKTACSE